MFENVSDTFSNVPFKIVSDTFCNFGKKKIKKMEAPRIEPTPPHLLACRSTNLATAAFLKSVIISKTN